MKWFKLWTDARNDAKLRCLTDREHRIWFRLLCLAAEQEPPGIIKMTWNLLAVEVSDSNVESLKQTVTACNVLQLVTPVSPVTCENDVIKLVFPAFEKRQEKTPSEHRDRVRERVAKHRATRRYVNHVTGNDPVTPPVTGVTDSNGQTKTKTKTKNRRGDAHAPAHAKDPESPPPLLKTLGPEYEAVGQWATEVMGDVFWGRWVDDQGRFGHPADWIKLAIEKSVTAGKRDGRYIAGILQGWRRDGGLPKSFANGKSESSKKHPPPTTPEQEEAARATYKRAYNY